MPNRFGGSEMLEVYVIVEQQKSLVKNILSAVFFLAGAFFMYQTFMVSPTFMGIALLLLFIGLIISNRKVEHEYSYFDGDFRFARIINKEKRKELPSYDVENVIIIAPKGDRSIYQYENNPQVKTKDYSSGKADAKVYAMIVSVEGVFYKILFEPDERYLDAVCTKYNQKVVR